MNTVYVLGAGFSMPYMPPQAKVLQELLEYTADHIETPASIEFVAAQANMKQYREVWLEDVFTWLDHSLTRGNWALDSRSELMEVRRNIYFSLSYFFNERSKRIKNVRQRLNFMSKRSDLSGIITLNWDTLLDRCFKFNYGTAINSTQGSLIRQGSVPLLKLHGSSNWFECARCHNIVQDGSLDVFLSSDCPVCKKYDTQFNPILMTPTLMKRPGDGLLADVWRRAFVLFSTADEVIFMGYSLPLADHALFHHISDSIGPNTIMRAVLIEQDRGASPDLRFTTLFPGIEIDFSGIDDFLLKSAN